MDIEKIFYQYQKHIAMIERMHLNEIPARELVMAGTAGIPDLPPPELTQPEGMQGKIWRSVDTQEVVARLREARN
jgi:hypothetical protein